MIIVRKLLRYKVELTRISCALGVTEETTLAWRRRAAETATVINPQLWRRIPVTQVQRDAMGRFIRRKHAQPATPDGDSTEESTEGRQWVWGSFAPEFRLWLAASVGPRTFQSALVLIQRTAAVVRGVPCCFSDGFSRSLPALVAV